MKGAWGPRSQERRGCGSAGWLAGTHGGRGWGGGWRVLVWVPWAGSARCREESREGALQGAREARQRAPRPCPPPPALQAAPWAAGWGPGAERAAAHTHLGAIGGARLAALRPRCLESGREESSRRPSSGRRPPSTPAAWAGSEPPPRSAGRGRPPAAPRSQCLWPRAHADPVTRRSAGTPDPGSQPLAWGVCLCSALFASHSFNFSLQDCRAAALASVHPLLSALQPSPYLTPGTYLPLSLKCFAAYLMHPPG